MIVRHGDGSSILTNTQAFGMAWVFFLPSVAGDEHCGLHCGSEPQSTDVVQQVRDAVDALYGRMDPNTEKTAAFPKGKATVSVSIYQAPVKVNSCSCVPSDRVTAVGSIS